jgi:hypothetical protein
MAKRASLRILAVRATEPLLVGPLPSSQPPLFGTPRCLHLSSRRDPARPIEFWLGLVVIDPRPDSVPSVRANSLLSRGLG